MKLKQLKQKIQDTIETTAQIDGWGQEATILVPETTMDNIMTLISDNAYDILREAVEQTTPTTTIKVVEHQNQYHIYKDQIKKQNHIGKVKNTTQVYELIQQYKRKNPRHKVYLQWGGN